MVTDLNPCGEKMNGHQDHVLTRRINYISNDRNRTRWGIIWITEYHSHNLCNIRTNGCESFVAYIHVVIAYEIRLDI